MMNLDYGDARNKNNSTGQNKFNKFTSNTHASSLINSISSFPTLTSSLNSNITTVRVCVSEMFLTRFRRGLSGKHIYMIAFLIPQAVWVA